ncbi:hypothetical protein [Rhodobacter capsulatus]|uniref:hypothetical protein n=1 Tax=Rhodobacter capsulatus TaxID=1061 RepID=UPI00402905AE
MQILEVLPDHGINAPGAAQKRTPRKMPQEAFLRLCCPDAAGKRPWWFLNALRAI